MLSRIASVVRVRRLLGARSRKIRTPIIYITAPDSNIARAGLWFPVGAADDTKQGMAHFLEHILMEQISDRQRAAVLRCNALTSFYWTAYTWAGDLDALEYVLALQPDIVRNIPIASDMIERHRRIIQMELLVTCH